MGRYIMQTPTGTFAVWNDQTSDFLLVNATTAEVVSYFVTDQMEQLLDRVILRVHALVASAPAPGAGDVEKEILDWHHAMAAYEARYGTEARARLEQLLGMSMGPLNHPVPAEEE